MFINYAKGKVLIGSSRGAWEHDLYEHSIPQAQISASTNSVACQTPLVQFRDYSVMSNGGGGASYAWSFPGGTPATSTAETPLVSYEGSPSGDYDVTLTVTDQYGTSTQTLTGFIHYLDSACCESAPVIWTKTDLGTASAPSELCYTVADGNFEITAHSIGCSDPDDNIPFIYQKMVGDGNIIARVKDVTDTWNYSGGIMVRNSLAANSAHLYLSSLDTRGVFDLYRLSDGGNTGYQVVTAFAMPMWLKIERIGNQLSSFYSPDGVSWTSYHQFTMNLNDTIYLGLVANSTDCVTNIDNATVNGNVINAVAENTNTELNIYPNPFKNDFTVDGMTGENVIEIFDATGKLITVITTTEKSKTINTENFADGMYVVKVKSSRVEKTLKITKQ
jgi:PKD repeat protein